MFFDKVVANLMFFLQNLWQIKSYKYKQKILKSTNFVASCGKTKSVTYAFFYNLPQIFVEIILRGKKKIYFKKYFGKFSIDFL